MVFIRGDTDQLYILKFTFSDMERYLHSFFYLDFINFFIKIWFDNENAEANKVENIYFYRHILNENFVLNNQKKKQKFFSNILQLIDATVDSFGIGVEII